MMLPLDWLEIILLQFLIMVSNTKLIKIKLKYITDGRKKKIML